VDGDDVDDYRRDLQLCRLRLCRCYSGYAAWSAVCRHYYHLVCNFPEGKTQFRRQNWMLQLHHWIGGNCNECATAIIRRYDTRYETLCYCARVLDVCWSPYSWMCFHSNLGRTSLRQEEHAGIPEYLQSNWRLECGGNPRTRRGSGCTGVWKAPIQSMVPLHFVSFCCYNTRYGDHLPEREYSPPGRGKRRY
jgi:hypothetical protein